MTQEQSAQLSCFLTEIDRELHCHFGNSDEYMGYSQYYLSLVEAIYKKLVNEDAMVTSIDLTNDMLEDEKPLLLKFDVYRDETKYTIEQDGNQKIICTWQSGIRKLSENDINNYNILPRKEYIPKIEEEETSSDDLTLIQAIQEAVAKKLPNMTVQELKKLLDLLELTL